MGSQHEFRCSGFEMAGFRVPPFEVLAHQLAFVRWPGRREDRQLPAFLRILGGVDAHPAVSMRKKAGMALPLAALVFPERRFPRKGSFLSWVKRELDESPHLVDPVMQGLPTELNVRPLEEIGAGPFVVIAVRLALARNGLVVFSTEGIDALHTRQARDSVTAAGRGQVEGCGIEVLTEGQAPEPGDMPDSIRVQVTATR